MMSELTCGWLSTALCSAYPVTSHTVPPSRSRTRVSGASRWSARRAGGGSNGHAAALTPGNSGRVADVS
ncbi:hypothetical protein [Streptosporangium sandarakinum]